MKLSAIYRCFSDETRLRILNLLAVSPLCVCHLQTVLGKSQVVVSQHLAYLRQRRLVTGLRYRNWTIYALPDERPPVLQANLECLQAAFESEPVLRKDLRKLKQLIGTQSVAALLDEGCCARLRAASSPRRKSSL